MIKHEPVVCDINGEWEHSCYDDFIDVFTDALIDEIGNDEDDICGLALWMHRHGLGAIKIVTMEEDDPKAYESYVNDEYHLSEWNPSYPSEDHILIGIWDSDVGPIAHFALNRNQ